MALKLVFMGTPDIAVSVLDAVHGAGHDIVAVYTQPPKPAGRRGLELRQTPVHDRADALGLPVRHPVSLKSPGEHDAFAALGADVAVVVAYGLLLPKPVLDAPRFGCLNAHASRLPRWRGAAPIQRAIMAGDTQTAMMVMRMDEGLDTGPVALAEDIAIGPDMTAGQLHDAMAVSAARLMVNALAALEAGPLTFMPQSEDGATYARKIDKAETRADFSLPASSVHNHIRGLSPFPGAWCEMVFNGRAERVKLLGSTLQPVEQALAVPCADGTVHITRLQRAGGKALDAREFLRGATPEAIR